MDRHEIYREIQMTYEELLSYLLQKYGGAVCDYFATPECKSKNKKVTRTAEGLYCHHMDEDKGGNLSNSAQAQMQPFEWQKKERLVYCNIIEHLILHMKIAVLRQKDFLRKPFDVNNFFSTGGIFMVCHAINDMFMNNGTSVPWQKRCFKEVENNYEEYIFLVRALLMYIDSNYYGEKNNIPFLQPGSIVHFSDCDCEIVDISKKKNAIRLKLPNGELKACDVWIAILQLEYLDYLDIQTRTMASGFKEFYEKIYNDVVNCRNENEILAYANALKIDYNGYGYVQYANIELTEDFGAKNADEYISKGLPMHSDKEISLEGKEPRFWKGSIIPEEVAEAFYIIRIEAMFDVKKGNEPFVIYREFDSLRGGFSSQFDDNNNFITKNRKILSTSDIYDRETKKFYSQYVREGKVLDATVVLTLGREDYILFQELYDIRYLKILDGCYFV